MMFLIPFPRALNVAHAEGYVIEIGGIKGGGRVGRTRCSELGLLISEGDRRAQSRGKHAGQMRDQLPPAHPAVLEVVNQFDDLSLHGRSLPIRDDCASVP